MYLFRPAHAQHPLRFGRARARPIEQQSVGTQLAGDIKLFACTFLAGFLFVSILIG